MEAAEMQFPGAPERVRLTEVVRALVDRLVTGLIEGTMNAAQGIQSIEGVRHHPERIARYTEETSAANRQLKSLLRANVYQSEIVVAERRHSMAKIAELFDYLLNHLEALPHNYLDDSSANPPHRIVCDYIAGMTDGFFERTYDQLLGRG
jgi:dGTPase